MKRFIFTLLGISAIVSLLLINPSTVNSQTVRKQKLQRVKTYQLALSPKIIMKRGQLESPRNMKLYNIKPLGLRTNLVRDLSKRHYLKSQPIMLKKRSAPQIKLYRDKEKDFTRMIVNERRGHIQLLPNLQKLEKVNVKLLQRSAAMNAARNYIRTMKLIPKDVSRFTPQKVITLSSANVKGGNQSKSNYKKSARSRTGGSKLQTTRIRTNQNQLAIKRGLMRGGQAKLQSVQFQRILNNKPVLGKGSQLVVNLGNNGTVEGFQRSWNNLSQAKMKVSFRSNKEVYDRIEQKLKQEIQGNAIVEVGRPKLLYYGNDGKFVQPAYFYSAKITSPKSKVVSYYAGYVSALRNSPERIVTTPNIGPSGMPKGPLTVMKGLKLKKKLAPVPFNDPYVGRYVNRNDSKHWVGDANDFKRGLIAGHRSGYPPITFPQYYWNYPRLFQSQDNSFVDRCHVVLMEGHGANWLFSTDKNCCDLVNINSTSQPGYGGHAGGRMTFIIYKSCSVVPAPPDRSDWATPWWRVFKGLRQAIGFRTTMYINDNISYIFGYYIARNCRVLDSWFYATNSSSSYQHQRSSGGSVTGYGAVVMIPGHEGDGIYHINPAPSATTTGLTIWWQH
ncbi:MAG: hypothetical protein GY940_04865 [bacterium]|nr:hypothetical protein [bacterium]